MARWLYFERADELEKWMEEVISMHERWGHTKWLKKYRRALDYVKRFTRHPYSLRCTGYILIICYNIDVIAVCRDGETIQHVDVREWLEEHDI